VTVMPPDKYEEFAPPDRSWTDHPLFHGLTLDALRQIAKQVTIRRYQLGAAVFRQGDEATHLFVIRSGEVQIRRELDGQDLVINTLRRGDVFGEMGLLTDYRRNASVVATAPSEVVAVSRGAFDILIAQNFAVASELVQILNARSLDLERATALSATGTGGGAAPGSRPRDPELIQPGLDHQVFTVFSPAGGAGKTMLACNLGVLLARKMPHNVVLVDLCLTASQCALVLNVTGKRSLAAYAAAGGLKDLVGFDALTWHTELLGQHRSGLGVLSMAHTALEAVTLTAEIVDQVLKALTKVFPIVIVDTTSVYTDVILTALSKATRLLLVSNYELTSLRAMMECVTALDDPEKPLAQRSLFILNNTRAKPPIRAQEFEARVKLPVRFQLPFGDELPSIAVRDGSPIVELKPNAPLARELGAIVDHLVAVPAPTASRR